MIIRDRSPTFKKEWKIELHSRKAIILPLINRIINAKNITELDQVYSCDQGLGVCVIYNLVGKLYFKHDKDASITLLKYVFANHDV